MSTKAIEVCWCPTWFCCPFQSMFGMQNIIQNISWLTHWGRVIHICISKLTIIGLDNGLSPDRHQAINQCWNIVNWTPQNKLQWNFNLNSNIFIKKKWISKCRLENGGHFVLASMFKESLCYGDTCQIPKSIWKFLSLIDTCQISNWYENSYKWFGVFVCSFSWDLYELSLLSEIEPSRCLFNGTSSIKDSWLEMKWIASMRLNRHVVIILSSQKLMVASGAIYR